MTIVLSGTIVGGVIAGASGLAGTYYTLRHQRVVEIDNWLSQLDHLTSRITIDLDGNDADKQRESKRIFLNTYPRLEDHLSTAPFKLSEDIRDKQDELALLQRSVSANKAPKNALEADLLRCEELTDEIYSESESLSPTSNIERLRSLISSVPHPF
ncbi:hypothetical protein [Halorubrum ezzemoulense]|uniref:hypothetical protein n=1 Tax=Halorubrum ezzemoulense TaxID=337243 RepID=UPI00117A7983|nr:hypothetical protein [Halorubrum ezzemoulense]